jgi:hypothetical protein
MRRKAKDDTPRQSKPFDLKKDIDQELIWGMGAASLIWNTIEQGIEVSLGLAADIPPKLWVSVSSRINGVDGKIAIIKDACKRRIEMPDSVYLPIAQTLGAIGEHKKYRDALIHVRLINPDDPIAPTFQQRGDSWEVLVSKEAVYALCTRLNYLRDEMDTVIVLFHHTKRWEMAGRDPQTAAATRVQVEEEMRRCLQVHRLLLNRRAKLPPLPEFPEEHSIQSDQGQPAAQPQS